MFILTTYNKVYLIHVSTRAYNTHEIIVQASVYNSQTTQTNTLSTSNRFNTYYFTTVPELKTPAMVALEGEI